MKYNILFPSGFREVEGKPVKEMEKYGKYCIHKESNEEYWMEEVYWVVDEYTSGTAICEEKTYERAIERAIDLIKTHGIEKTKKLIEKSIKQYGVANE